MEEIPLVYPNNHKDATRRYVLDLNAKRLQISRVSGRNNNAAEEVPSVTSPAVFFDPLDEIMEGAASVSTLKLRGQEVLVTTSALVETPNIISVALSCCEDGADGTLESPTLVELDVKDFRVISIHAFIDDIDTEGSSSSASAPVPWNNKLILLLVDRKGTIVTASLDGNLVPDTEVPLKVLTREDYIPPPLLEQVGVSDLQRNMLSFFPTKNNCIVMALAPLIVTVDWKDTGKSSVWSETQCLEEMATASSLFSGIISKLPGFGNTVDVDVVDLPPTAALCVSTNNVKLNHAGNEDATAVLVFTLHSDASIRKWRIEPEKSLFPIEVSTLRGNKVCLPSTWSDGRKSVALCARVYEQTFALAVHIKTNSLSSYDEGVSDCNIWVFEGPDKVQYMEECRIMKVPRDAVSLVGMSFLASEKRCTLSVVFEAVSDGGNNRETVSSGIQIVNYPPSLLSIVSSEPVVVEMTSLDKIATTERDRIRSLPYGSIVFMEIENDNESEYHTDITVDQALHRLDSLYMKHLFRPIFPRGNGTVLPPSETCIRRAMSKIVHGNIKDYGSSVELETIKTLYEWRNRDKRKARISSPSKTNRFMNQDGDTPSKQTPTKGSTSLTVYNSFVDPDEHTVNENIVMQNEDDKYEQFEEELCTEIESHENRWQRLLYQIWEEEQTLRSPLCVSWLKYTPFQILVRGNVTTALANNCYTSRGDDEKIWKDILQDASSDILDVIEANNEKSGTLYEIEEQLVFIVSQAQLVISAQTSIIENLTSLGRWARLQGNNGSKDAELRKIINQVPTKDLVAWIESPPSDLGIFTTEPTQIQSDKNSKWSGLQVAKSQLRHASCSCAIRATDLIRRSMLSKCLLVLELSAGNRTMFTAAFRSYVHAIAILWTSAQRIKMPDITFQKKSTVQHTTRRIQFVEDGSPQTGSPPTKRSNYGNVISSIFESSSLTSTLDVTMIRISQEITGSSNAAPFCTIMKLCESYVNLIFSKQDDPCSLLPELKILPKTKDDERPNDHLDLSLRLLAPFVAFQIPDDSLESIVARKEQLSLCLLHAAHFKSISPSKKSQMREMACDLLLPKNQDTNNLVPTNNTKKGLDVLVSITGNRITAVVDDERLRELMHQLIPTASSLEILRLCRLSTTRKLFSFYTLTHDTNLDNATYSHAVQIAKLMLQLSRTLHRLSIIENYIFTSEEGEFGDNENSDSLLQLISDAISDMKNSFPDEFLRKMPEYISIWTKKFDHAVRANDWTQAYSSCVQNPEEKHKESNFKRLVRTMVDAGALNELLDMCTQIGIGNTTPLAAIDDNYEEAESIDLYEIAADVLLSYADCDFYDSRASSSFSTNLSDYQGALYALHASQEQWRRAAQSLDLRYVNAKKALLRPMSKVALINIQSSELRDGLIIQDLVLSGCGAANVIQLVKDPDYRFLVSGEYSPYSKIYFGDNDPMKTPNKLKRGRETNEIISRTVTFEENVDRLSKFMITCHLDGRAIRAIVLRLLFFDRSTNYAKSAFRRGLDDAKSDVDELFKSGYYKHGLLLAKACSKAFIDGKTKPGGVDLFGNCLNMLMGNYLVPLASSPDDVDQQRPTLQQLQDAIDASGSHKDTASYIVSEKSVRLAYIKKVTTKAATFTLLRKLTINHSSADIPLAIDVAASFLEQDNNNMQIPHWLERILIGVDETDGGAGAFAPMPKADCKHYLGNPSALLALYTNRGMFTEACNVVTSILGDSKRTSKAASRLPEKGDIDYVPYRSIDLLWNMIEIACSKGIYDISEENRILNSRDEMEKALKQHIANMEISETGMRSARMLST